MQELDFLLLLLADILLVVLIGGIILFIIARRRIGGNMPINDQYPTQDSGSEEGDSEEIDEASRIVGWIRTERKKAQDSIDHGELREASERLSVILENLYRDIAKLAPLGPKNSSEIKDEIEYTLDETTAKILLDDLQDAVGSVTKVPSESINVLESESQWDLDQLDTISREGNRLADEVEELAERRNLVIIRNEARLLLDELRTKIEKARGRLRGS